MISAYLKDQFTVLRTSEVRDLESQAVQEGTPVKALMERASAVIVEEILAHFSIRPTLVLCGPGNNGGDAYGVAVKLLEIGWPVEVMTVLPANSKTSNEAAYFKEKYKKKPLSPDTSLDAFELIIDGIFGTGLKKDLSADLQVLIHKINLLSLPVISVDIPTGIDSDTGEIRGASLHAKMTVTFNYRKPGHLLYPGKLSCGEVILKDIGLGKARSPMIFVNHPELWFDDFPIPGPLDHKYHRGHALLFGGEEFTGATQLAALAARRAGAGLVSIACTERTHPIYALSTPGTITSVIRSFEEWEALLKDERKNALLLGPGLTPSPETKKTVLAALKTKRRIVLDAGALKAFLPDDVNALFSALHDQVVLTPHEGEFKEIFGTLSGSKIERALEAANKSGGLIYLKGADSVMATPQCHVLLQDNAPPWLSTAGTGDVLAGLILAFLAQGASPLHACGMASWIHGESAHHAGFGMIAEDLLDHLQNALQGIPDHLVYF